MKPDKERLKELREEVYELLRCPMSVWNGTGYEDVNELTESGRDLLALIDSALAEPSDADVAEAIEWMEIEKETAQNSWERAGAEWRMEPGAQEMHDEQMAAFDLAITALSQMRTEPDCSTAEWQGGYCLGYGKSDTDDEPCDVCKSCPKQASYADDKCEWCDKTLTLFTNSGKYIPENQPPRNYCPNCGRHIGGE